MNLFDQRPVGCLCLDLVDAMAYDLEQVAPPLCPQHDTETIVELERARLRAVADERAAITTQVVDSFREPEPPCTCPDVTEALHAALMGVEFDECVVHPPATPSAQSTVSPGDDDSLANLIRVAFGQSDIPLNNPDDWHPPDAA